ncbi:hypothetical protein COBT_002432 [Conglomerata obtusa]
MHERKKSQEAVVFNLKNHKKETIKKMLEQLVVAADANDDKENKFNNNNLKKNERTGKHTKLTSNIAGADVIKSSSTNGVEGLNTKYGQFKKCENYESNYVIEDNLCTDSSIKLHGTAKKVLENKVETTEGATFCETDVFRDEEAQMKNVKKLDKEAKLIKQIFEAEATKTKEITSNDENFHKNKNVYNKNEENKNSIKNFENYKKNTLNKTKHYKDRKERNNLYLKNIKNNKQNDISIDKNHDDIAKTAENRIYIKNAEFIVKDENVVNHKGNKEEDKIYEESSENYAKIEIEHRNNNSCIKLEDNNKSYMQSKTKYNKSMAYIQNDKSWDDGLQKIASYTQEKKKNTCLKNDSGNKKDYRKKNQKEYQFVRVYNKDNIYSGTNENVNEDEFECPVCLTASAQTIEFECKHTICFKCTSRLFLLVKDRKCPICKESSNVEVPTHYIRPKCQICQFIATTHAELVNHYKKHGKLLCNECTHNKAEFPSEYTLYTPDNLSKHLNIGLDDENVNGFFGHIYCIFCLKYFYSVESCIKHCRTQHAICTICESLKKRHNYLRNMDELKIHTYELHYMCEFKGCEGIGFGYNSELVEHLLRKHKVGDGRVNLNVKKNKTVHIMNPYEAELKNKEKIRGREKTKSVLQTDYPWQMEENGDINNFNMKTPGIREFTYEPKVKQNTPRNNSKLVMLKREMVLQPETIIPAYLKRESLKEEIDRLKYTKEYFQSTFPQFADDIYKIYDTFIKRQISVESFFTKIELIITDKETIKYMTSILMYVDLDSKKVIENYLKVYKENVIFPKFVKKEVKVYKEEKKEKKFGFKIVDIRKK